MKGRINLHIFLAHIQSETRLYKETTYTLQEGLFSRVVVCGLWGVDLSRKEVSSWGLEIYRKKTLINFYKKVPFLRKAITLRKICAGVSLIQYGLFVLWKAAVLRPTHVSCHNVALLPLSWLAARLLGAHLIYVPHELETERAHLQGKAKIIQSWVEQKFIRFAREIVVVCDPIAQWYRENYTLDNVSTVRNVPKRADTARSDRSKNILRDIFKIPDSALIVIYQGVLGPARGTSRLLETFAALDGEHFHLVLMGFGDATVLNTVDIAVEENSNIHYQPAVPMSEIISYTASADVAIFVTNESALSYRFSLPNKFFEYMHGGLPVIVSDNLEYLSSIVRTENLGWIAPYNDIKTVIESISIQQSASYRERALCFAKRAVWEIDAEAYRHIYRS